eukprot:UN24415
MVSENYMSAIIVMKIIKTSVLICRCAFSIHTFLFGYFLEIEFSSLGIFWESPS